MQNNVPHVQCMKVLKKSLRTHIWIMIYVQNSHNTCPKEKRHRLGLKGTFDNACILVWSRFIAWFPKEKRPGLDGSNLTTFRSIVDWRDSFKGDFIKSDHLIVVLSTWVLRTSGTFLIHWFMPLVINFIFSFTNSILSKVSSLTCLNKTMVYVGWMNVSSQWKKCTRAPLSFFTTMNMLPITSRVK